VRKEVLGLLPPDGDAQFEHAVYPKLIDRGELLAWPTDHRYYSVSDHSRLDATERFLARRPAVLLDRDGVLNRRPPRASYVRGPEELEWLPGAREALRLFHEHGFTTIVVTNQPGIARGEMTARDLARVHERLCADALEAGGRIDALFHCPHGWDEGCECRKPRPGMLFAAQRRFDLDLSRVTFVGDDERDEEAADAAGCRFEYASEAAPLIDVARGLVAGAGERSVVGAA
jgi:D-glycero-D-manno-heptose 1,7-bisphosphate phosphatase